MLNIHTKRILFFQMKLQRVLLTMLERHEIPSALVDKTLLLIDKPLCNDPAFSEIYLLLGQS